MQEQIRNEEAIKEHNLATETLINRKAVRGDLFLTKEQALENFCKSKGFFSKADLYEYGLKNYYLSAERRVREWVTEGKVRHLTQDECAFRGLRGKMAWYETIKQK